MPPILSCRKEEHDHRAPPIGVWGIVLLVGWGLLGLASLIGFFSDLNDIPDEDVASAIFAEFGLLAVAAGLGLAGLLRDGLTWGVRAALIIAASFFLVQAAGGALLSSMMAGMFGRF